jgi:hypothetical protein
MLLVVVELGPSNQPLAFCKNLRPRQDPNRLPQSRPPKWILFHERMNSLRAVGLDDPQPTGRITGAYP